LGSGGNRAVDVVGDVAEDSAEQEQISGGGSEVGVAGSCVGAADLDVGEAEAGDVVRGSLSVPGVGFDERGCHAVGIASAFQHFA